MKDKKKLGHVWPC